MPLYALKMTLNIKNKDGLNDVTIKQRCKKCVTINFEVNELINTMEN